MCSSVQLQFLALNRMETIGVIQSNIFNRTIDKRMNNSPTLGRSCIVFRCTSSIGFTGNFTLGFTGFTASLGSFACFSFFIRFRSIFRLWATFAFLCPISSSLWCLCAIDIFSMSRLWRRFEGRCRSSRTRRGLCRASA